MQLLTVMEESHEWSALDAGDLQIAWKARKNYFENLKRRHLSELTRGYVEFGNMHGGHREFQDYRTGLVVTAPMRKT